MSSSENQSLRRYLRPLRDFWPLIILVTVGAVALGFVADKATSVTYESQASVLVNPATTSAIGSLEVENRDVDMETEVRLAQSATVADGAAELLATTELSMDSRDLSKMVTAAGDRGTRIMDVTFEADTPEQARLGAQAFADAYLAYRNAQATAQRDAARDGVSATIAELKTTLAGLEADLNILPDGSNEAIIRTIDIRATQDDLDAQQTELTKINAIVVNAGEVIDPARAPRSPNGLTRSQILLGALVGGLVLGVLLAYLLSALRKTEEDDDGAETMAEPMPSDGGTGNQQPEAVQLTTTSNLEPAPAAALAAPAAAGFSAAAPAELGQAPLVDVPQIDVPQAPKVDVPQVPNGEVPEVEVPEVDVPEISADIPDIDTTIDVPEVEVPEVDAPEISADIPDIDTTTDIPETNGELPDFDDGIFSADADIETPEPAGTLPEAADDFADPKQSWDVDESSIVNDVPAGDDGGFSSVAAAAGAAGLGAGAIGYLSNADDDTGIEQAPIQDAATDNALKDVVEEAPQGDLAATAHSNGSNGSTNGVNGSGYQPTPGTDTVRLLTADGDFEGTIKHMMRIGAVHPVVAMVVEGDPVPSSVPVSFWLAQEVVDTGARVLVVDMQLQKPKVHEMLSTSLSPGLAEVLSGQEKLRRAVRTSAQLGAIEVLTVGNADNLTVEQLLGEAFTDLLAEARRRYHVIILIAGSVQGSNELRTVARHTDGLVVGSGLPVGGMADDNLLAELGMVPAEVLSMISIHRPVSSDAREAAGTDA